MMLRCCLAGAAISVAALASPPLQSQAPVNDDARLNAFLDAAYDARAQLSPQQSTSLGSRIGYDRLDDYTSAAEAARLALMRSQLADMRHRFDPNRLSAQGRLSFELFERGVQTAEANAPWEDYRFTFSVLGSPATDVPAFLVNNHRVASVADADAYVARIRDIERVMKEVSDGERRRVAKGLIEPAFAFDTAIENARAQVRGAPFDEGADSVLWADFKRKVEKLDTDEPTRARLLAAGRDALVGPMARGYANLIATLQTVAPLATSNAGVWRLPKGDAYYSNRIRFYTGTDLTADEIHTIGLREMQRIHDDMRVAMTKLGFRGTREQFFSKIRSEGDYRYSNDEAGRAEYLATMKRTIADALAKSPAFFSRMPRASLEVKAVEPWRAAGAPSAFYGPGAPDGSRPATFYVNLSDMSQTFKLQSAAIACHEAVPGHHFESSFALEITDLPKFRRFGAGYIAFGEGWGLYSEQLCREMGVYREALDEFGQLSMDAWRAARLVVDTGLHAKRWSREQARAYMKANTLLSDVDIGREVDRYLCLPGQATSYKIGHLRILALRRKAEKALGPKFDIKAFHDAVLSGGGVPLDLLERQVDAYIAAAGPGVGAPPSHARLGKTHKQTGRSLSEEKL